MASQSSVTQIANTFIMPSLAPELVLQILEAAYSPSLSSPNPDTCTLSNASLVCSVWRPLAQEVLFRNIVLTRPPQSRAPAARAAPGILLAASSPSHALRETRAEVTPPVSRASRLQALIAAATPSAPTPRSQKSTQAFLNALQIDSPRPSDRALGLSLLVRSVHLFVAEPDPAAACKCGGDVHLGGICPKPCSVASPLPTGALTERHLAMLFARLPYLRSAHIILDRVNSFSPLTIDALRASTNVSTLSVHVLKRPYSRVPMFNANNAIASSTPSPTRVASAEENPDSAVFQLIHALAPNLDTLLLEGELPRDPPADASSRVVRTRRVAPGGSLSWSEEEVVAEPAPNCSLRELIWRGRLPPSPALLTWLLSAKAQGVAPARRRSRLEVLELCYLPPPDALAELLREHVPTLRSLRLHYFESAHVDVVRQLLGRDAPITPAQKRSQFGSEAKLNEIVLHRQCAKAPDMLLAVQAQHVAVTQPCNKTLQVLEGAGRCGFQRVTVIGGDRGANEQVRRACEADGVAFANVGALTPVW